MRLAVRRGRWRPFVAGAFLFVVAGVTCSEPSGPRGRAAVAFVPVFGADAAAIYSNLVDGGLAIDNIRIQLERKDGTTAIDTSVAVAGQDSLVIELTVEIDGTSEVFSAQIDMRDGSTVLFSGSQSIVAIAGTTPTTPPEIPMKYEGPGATVVALDLAPADSAISTSDSVVYRLNAKDKDSATVADFAVIWSLKDTSRGRISEAGVFKPNPSRGSTYVIAKTYKGVKDSARVSITPAATKLVVISGNAQTGPVNGNLPQALVVESQAADNLPVPGVTATLNGPPGTVVLQMSDKTDQNGRISFTVPVGTIAGPIAFSVASPGLPTLALTGTALAGAPNKLAVSQQPSATAASGAALATQPKVQLQDAFGNAAAVAGKPVVAALTTAAGRTLGGTTTVNTDANGVATFTNLVVSGPIGSLTLKFTQDTLTAATSNAITLGVGAAAKVLLATRPSSSVTSGVLFAQHPIARISDEAGNTVTTSSAIVTLTASAGYSPAGLLSVAAVNGIATYTQVVVSGAAGNALLTFASTGLASDTATVTVVPGFGPPAVIAPTSPLAFIDSIQGDVASLNLATVVIKDAQNVAVSGAEVKFRLRGGLGSRINGVADSVVVITGSNGEAKLTSQKLRDSIAVDSVLVTVAGITDTVKFLAGVLNGAPHHLTVLGQPSDVEAGQPIGVVVVLQDRLNNIASVFTGSPPNVTLAIRSGFGSAGAVLSPAPSALTQPATSGVASFLVSIDLVGSDYALTASAPGFTSVHTADFQVTAPVPDAVTWVNPAGGNWSVASNWSTGVVPTSADIVKIDLAGTYTVTLDVNVSVKALCIGGATGTATVTASSKTITITEESFVYGTGVLSLTSSTIDGTGLYHNEGLILAHGTSAINVAFDNTVSGTLRVPGQTSGSNAALTVLNGFTNDGLIELTSANSGFSSNLTVTNGTLTNSASGTINSMVGTGGSRSLTAQVSNEGLIETQQNLTLNKPDADHVNSGSIVSQTANMIVTQTGTTPTFTNLGSITLGASRDISISGGESNFSSGTVSGPVNSTFIVSGSALSFSTTTILVPVNLAGASTIVGGVVTVPTGQTLRFLSGTLSAALDIQSGGTAIVHGVMSMTGAVTNSGTLQVQGQSFGSNASLTIANGFTNNGLIELTSANSGFSSTLNVTSGTLINAAGATIRTSVGTGGSRTLGFVLDNQGTLDVDQQATLTKASAAHVNSGAIDLTVANLTVTHSGTTPSFANTGTVTLGASRTLTVSGTAGTVNLSAGTVTGTSTSTLVVNTQTLSFATTTVTIPMTLLNTSISGGSVTVPDGQTLTLLSGGLTDPVTIEDGGTLRTLGTVSLTTLVMDVNAMLQPRGQSNGSNSTLTVANGFTNNGTIELISAESGFSSTLNVTSGSLVNAAGGFIRSMVGTGGARTLGVQLDNQGSFEAVQATTLDKASAAHVNSGTIFLTSANLTVTQSGAGASFTNTGTVTLGASRDFTVTGGTLDLSAGTVSGPTTSRLVVTGATLGFTTATVNVPMTLTTTSIIGSSVTIPTNDTLTLMGGGLSDNVTISSGGTLLSHGVVALNGLVTLPAGGNLTVRGQSTGSNATLTIANGFSNYGTILLHSANSGFSATLAVTNGPLINEVGATIHSAAGSGGSRLLAAELDNRGTLDVDLPLMISKADAQHVNSGAIDMTVHNLTVTQSGTASPSFTNTGTITLAAGRTLTVSGGTLDLSAGTVSGTATSTLAASSSTLSFTPSTVTIPLTLTSTTVNGGSLTIGTSQTVTLLGGGLSDPVTINSGGTLLTHGTVSLTGALTQNGNLRVRGQSNGSNAFLVVANGFTNSGLIELTSDNSGFGATLAVTNGTLTNNSGGMIHADVGTGGSRTLEAKLQNNGTLDVDQPMTIDKADANHYNANSIDLTNASLTVSQSGTTPSFGNGIAGVITIGPSMSLIINGGTANFTGTSLVQGQATSRLSVVGGTLNFTPAHVTVPLSLTSSTAIAGGTVTIASGQTVTLLAGSMLASVTVQSGGLLKALASAAVTDLAVEAGGDLKVIGNSIGSNATLTVANGFTNNGTIELTSENSGFTSALAVTSGILTNSGVATINASVGAGGSRTIAAQLDNQGTVTVNQALTLDKASAQHTNSGLIDLTAANMTVTQTGTSPTFSNSGTIQLASGKTFAVSGGTLTNVGGDPSGTIQGPGTVNVSTAAFTNHGNMTPAGIQNVTGNYVQDVANGGTNIEMSSGVLGSGYGQLAISGSATLSGSLNVSLNDFLPILNQTFTIMTFASRTGTFSQLNLPDLTAFSLQWDVQYGATDIKLKLIAFP